MPRNTSNVKKVESKSTKESKPTKDDTPVDENVSKSVSKSKSKSAKSVSKSKSVKPKEPKEVTVVEVEAPDISDVEGPDGEVADSKKKRRVPTKESVVEGFDELVAAIEEEITRLRESPGKAKGVKFLRTLGKRTKTLRGHTVRVMKQKQKTNRKNNTNSGFLKPVQISKEMAKFTGWNHEDLKSRVDVTKYICKYIRDNNLQNPEDRRQIIADKKLAKLLEFSDDEEKPLTYYRIQTYMKKHFTNPPKVEEVSK
jgi:upstream activation factor subunit UAF30